MNVFIGCGSAKIEEINSIYLEETTKLATFLAKKDYNLICGGVDGLQGVVRDIFLKNKRQVNTIWVKNYWDRYDISNSTYVKYVNDRKTEFLKKADLLIIIPGALGTFDEIFNTIETKRAKEHNLPILIININDYFKGLIIQLKTMYKEKMANKSNEEYYHIVDNVEEAINYIEKTGECNE